MTVLRVMTLIPPHTGKHGPQFGVVKGDGTNPQSLRQSSEIMAAGPATVVLLPKRKPYGTDD